MTGTMRRPSLGLLCAVALVAVAAAHVLWLLSFAPRGFDFTDEASNTLVAMFPGSQSGLLTIVGYVTTLVWDLSGRSIPMFRLLGMGLLVACVVATTACALVHARANGLNTPRTVRWYVFAAAMGAIPFFYRDLYVLSPGYNWLAMIGLLTVQSGFYLLLSRRPAWMAILVFGLGGFLAFAGKPTSGVAILLLLSLVLLFTQDRWKYLPIIGASAVVAAAFGLACVLWLCGGLVGTYDGFVFGLHYFGLAQTGHTIPHSLGTLAATLLVTPWKVFLFTQKVSLAAVGAIAFCAWRLQWRSQYALAGILAISAIELATHDISYGSFNFYLVSSFALTLLAAAGALFVSTPDRMRDVSPRVVLLPLLLGAFVAIAHVFGTNNGPGGKLLLPTVSIVIPLVVFALWAEHCLRQRGAVLVVAFLSVVAGAVLLHRSAQHPSDLVGGISAQTEPVTFLGQSHPVGLDPTRAGYARAMLHAAAGAGWQPGTPLLNLTGHTPGANVILDAPFVAMPWLIGEAGKKRAADGDALAFVIATMPADVAARAWIITSRNGIRSLDPRIVHREGSTFPCGYSLAGEFPSYEDEGTVDGQQEMHQLWRPVAMAGCNGHI